MEKDKEDETDRRVQRILGAIKDRNMTPAGAAGFLLQQVAWMGKKIDRLKAEAEILVAARAAIEVEIKKYQEEARQ